MIPVSSRTRTFFAVFIIFITFSSNSAPLIQCDTQNINFGTIYEGETSALHHTFIIKNIGDKTLMIGEVKPGCGCTVVEYDSVIGPGKTGKIIQTTKLETFKSGPFTKSITVLSNAKNFSALRLTVSGKIISPLNFSKQFLKLQNTQEGKVSGSLIVGTGMSDFEIKQISFEQLQTGNPSWQKQPPLLLKYSMVRADKADSDGSYSYTVNFSFDIVSMERMSGKFVFVTNHPKRSHVEIRGVIVPFEEEQK